jgi:hypothetical protein
LQKPRQMLNNHPIVQILKMSQLPFPKCYVKYSSLLSSKITRAPVWMSWAVLNNHS